MKKPEVTNETEVSLEKIHEHYIENVRELKKMYDKHSLTLINVGIRSGMPIRPDMVEYYKDLRVKEY